MPTILAKDVVDRSEITLQDETNVRWSQEELLHYLNDGQRHVVMLKPGAYAQNSTFQLVQGSKQSAPNDAISLIRPVRNMGGAGNTPGRAITWADMDQLDLTRPDWHTETANAEVKHCLQDPQNPKDFYVTPPQPATPEYVEMIYSAAPPDATIDGVNGGGTDSAISLDDVYAEALYFYILFKAHSKESSLASPQKAGSYYQLFLGAIGMKQQIDAAQESRTAGASGPQ